MKLYYIAEATVPSYTAYSQHVMKMSNYLSKFFDVKLITLNQKKGFINKSKDVFEFYDVEKFDLKIINPSNYKFYNKFKLFFYILFEIKFFNKKIFLSRSPFISLLLILFNFKVIMEIHHPFGNKYYTKLFNIFIKKNNLLRVIVISNSLKKYFTKNINHNFHDKFIMLPDCSSVKNYEPKSSRLKFSKFNVGYVGSFYQGRGIDLIKKIAMRLKNYNFYLIGNEKDLINKKKFTMNNIHFLGFKDQKSLKKYYKIFNIVLAPYEEQVKVYGNKLNTSEYMSPLKIFEYMSFKKAIISSNNSVLKEVLKNNINCLICDYKNPSDWIQKIKLLSKNKKLFTKLSSQAHIDFKRKFTWSLRAEKIRSLIK